MNRREWGGGRVGVAQVSLRAEKPQEKVWKAEPREVALVMQMHKLCT